MSAKLSQKEIDQTRQTRWRARTDLVYLCQKILDYPNVEAEMHGPIIDVLQKFQKPQTIEQLIASDVYNGKTWHYTPLIDPYKLPGKRRALILWPRSTLKTTMNIQAHTIQWLLNYPDIAIAIFQSNLDKALDLVQEIKRHFQYNEKFRELFPEHCPLAGKEKDFGKADRFTLPSRKRGRREPSIVGISLEKGATGMHFDVMKFTDIVEPENVKTSDRIYQIKKDFYLSEPLLVTPHGWIDVEGTRYHQEDLYGELVERWFTQKKAGLEPSYKIAISSCWKRQYPDKPFYTPDSLLLPFAKDPDGKTISIWPHDNEGKPRLTWDYLQELKLSQPYVYSTQYLNSPEGGIDGREIFTVNDSRPVKISTTNFYTNVQVSYRVISIDTAETNAEYSNNSAISVGAFDAYNRCYIEDIRFGKWLPHELIQQIVQVIQKYEPQTVFIEKTSFVSGLMVGLNAALHRAGIYVPIEQVRRSTRIEKIERIQNSLQPWYQSGALRFVKKEEHEFDDAPKRGGINSTSWDQLIRELRNFPKGSDDILDSLSDIFTGKEYFGRLHGRNSAEGDKELIKQRQIQQEHQMRIEALKHHVGIAEDYEPLRKPSELDITGGL